MSPRVKSTIRLRKVTSQTPVEPPRPEMVGKLQGRRNFEFHYTIDNVCEVFGKHEVAELPSDNLRVYWPIMDLEAAYLPSESTSNCKIFTPTFTRTSNHVRRQR